MFCLVLYSSALTYSLISISFFMLAGVLQCTLPEDLAQKVRIRKIHE